MIRKHKTLARSLLYGFAIAVPLVALWVISRLSSPIDIGVHWQRSDGEYESIEAVKLLQQYIQIDTSHPHGNEIPGAEFLAKILEAEGIPYHLERIGTRNANLWAILEGEDPSALVLHNHIDVDSADDTTGWLYPPFDGVIKQPWLFGRGAFDMKNIAIAQLLAFIELKRQNVPLARSVMFLATGDEETGSRLGTRWILRHHPEVAARMGTVLTEGGVIEAVDLEDIKYWGTEVMQKRFIEVRACHYSRARLEALQEDIEALDRTQFRRRMHPVVESFWEEYGPTRANPAYQGLVARGRSLVDTADFSLLPPYMQQMVRNEIYPLSLELDESGGGYELWMVMMVLHDETVEDAMAELLPPWMTHGVALDIEDISPPVEPESLDNPTLIAIETFMRAEYPELTYGSYVIPGSASDARFFRAAGIPTYGYSPFIIIATSTLQMKKANERVALPSYLEGVDVYQRLVRSLAEAPAAASPKSVAETTTD